MWSAARLWQNEAILGRRRVAEFQSSRLARLALEFGLCRFWQHDAIPASFLAERSRRSLVEGVSFQFGIRHGSRRQVSIFGETKPLAAAAVTGIAIRLRGPLATVLTAPVSAERSHCCPPPASAMPGFGAEGRRDPACRRGRTEQSRRDAGLRSAAAEAPLLHEVSAHAGPSR